MTIEEQVEALKTRLLALERTPVVVHDHPAPMSGCVQAPVCLCCGGADCCRMAFSSQADAIVFVCTDCQSTIRIPCTVERRPLRAPLVEKGLYSNVLTLAGRKEDERVMKESSDAAAGKTRNVRKFTAEEAETRIGKAAGKLTTEEDPDIVR